MLSLESEMDTSLCIRHFIFYVLCFKMLMYFSRSNGESDQVKLLNFMHVQLNSTYLLVTNFLQEIMVRETKSYLFGVVHRIIINAKTKYSL